MMTTTQLQPKRGIVKQVLSGDAVIIRGTAGAPPPEKQVGFSSIKAPKLARRAVSNAPETKDEPYAWEAREFLRKKLIGEEVWFTTEKSPNSNRVYGTVFVGKDFNTAENMTEALINEGLVTVRNEGRNNAEVARFIELEDAAKAAGKGQWGENASKHVRDIKWAVEDPRNFVDKFNGKPVKAIIEHVRDGSTVRAFLLPDFHHITLMISGIRCPGFKLEDGKPDMNIKVPYAEEARYFVEIRLLQREVDIVLESVNNSNFVGTIQHPKGNIAEALLREGFTKCVDWSMAFMKSGADKLRAAERHAKTNRTRVWKDWQSTAPQITGKEKEFAGNVAEVINGDALMIKLANGQLKKVFLASIRPPREAGRATDEDGKTVPRPKGFRALYDIPWMYEAREFLRKKLVGKRVNVVVDYIQPAKDNFPEKICCTVSIGGNNVAEAMVSKGLATVVRHRQDDDQRSSHYDDLLVAETKATKSQKGIHAKKDIPSHRVVDITLDSSKAKQFLPSFMRQPRIEGIVEFVTSGARLKVFVPKDHCLCAVLLAGISCPRGARPVINGAPASESEPFGDEALNFTKERCLQREISIHVDSQDRNGNFIGWVWIDNVNLSVALVEEGFAAVHPTAERSEHYRSLKLAEDSAKEKRIKRWIDYVEEDKEEVQRVEEDKVVERKVKYEEVIITEVTSDLRFFAQNIEQGPNVESLHNKFRQDFQANPPLPGAYTPRHGDICAAKFTQDDHWYRAKVEKVSGSNVNVLYIDYGNREVINASRLANLPSVYTSEKAYAHEYVLACVSMPKDAEYAELAVKYMRDDTANRTLNLNIEYRIPGSPPAVTLTDPSKKEDLAKLLIADGVLLVENRRERRLHKLLAEYTAAQDAAKKSHLNMWEYGDVTEDDAKEFGLGR